MLTACRFAKTSGAKSIAVKQFVCGCPVYANEDGCKLLGRISEENQYLVNMGQPAMHS